MSLFFQPRDCTLQAHRQTENQQSSTRHQFGDSPPLTSPTDQLQIYSLNPSPHTPANMQHQEGTTVASGHGSNYSTPTEEWSATPDMLILLKSEHQPFFGCSLQVVKGSTCVFLYIGLVMVFFCKLGCEAKRSVFVLILPNFQLLYCWVMHSAQLETLQFMNQMPLSSKKKKMKTIIGLFIKSLQQKPICTS